MTAPVRGPYDVDSKCPLCLGNLNHDGKTDGVLTLHQGVVYHSRCLRVWHYAAEVLQARYDQDNVCQSRDHDPRWCPTCDRVEDGLLVGIESLFAALATGSSEATP